MGPEFATTAFAYEAVVVSSTAVALTGAVLAGANRALLYVEAADIRYRYDGGTPTAAEGMVAAVGDTIVLEGTQNLTQFKAIRSAGSDATLRATYEKGV